ncbi:MAG: iron chelate uptake ABC transporter family permease subunit [Planctomycetes bacterium]|nr:iron chelate uptake ABC transporter family permease subunit [Planctomycetota bacterium]
MHRTRRAIILVLVCLAVTAAYVLVGLNERNIGYNLPRRLHIVVAMAIIAVALGWSAACFQTITENHILTPNLIGLDSLYLFIQTAVVYYLGAARLTAMNNPKDFLLTVAIMVGAAALLYKALFKGQHGNIHFLVLVGLVAGQLFKALASFMQLRIDPNEFSVAQGKMFASFNNLNLQLTGLAALCAGGAFLISLYDFRRLDVLTLGRDQAISLGVPYTGVVRRQLLMVAVMVSAATVLGGPVAFLSILTVNAARRYFHTYRHIWVLIGSAVISLVCLLLGQIVVERILNFTVPSNVIINLVGGVYLFVLLLRQGSRG